MRIMGLDVGEKRIGIAMSDPMGWTAQGHSVLERHGPEQDFAHLVQLCSQYQIEEIIVGLPLNMNGTVGPKALEIKEFARQLNEYIDIPIKFWDERLSTVSAERILIQADVSRKKRKKVIDKMAAVNILQGYLDSLASR